MNKNVNSKVWSNVIRVLGGLLSTVSVLSSPSGWAAGPPLPSMTITVPWNYSDLDKQEAQYEVYRRYDDRCEIELYPLNFYRKHAKQIWRKRYDEYLVGVFQGICSEFSTASKRSIWDTQTTPLGVWVSLGHVDVSQKKALHMFFLLPRMGK